MRRNKYDFMQGAFLGAGEVGIFSVFNSSKWSDILPADVHMRVYAGNIFIVVVFLACFLHTILYYIKTEKEEDHSEATKMIVYTSFWAFIGTLSYFVFS